MPCDEFENSFHQSDRKQFVSHITDYDQDMEELSEEPEEIIEVQEWEISDSQYSP